MEEVGNPRAGQKTSTRSERAGTSKLPGDTDLPPTGIGDEDLSHMTNWLDCLRSRKQPNATVQNGFSHSVACIMAARAYWTGKKLYFDSKTEQILDHSPAA